jgi:hypothetical protein
MSDTGQPLSPKQRLFLILFPMLGTFMCQRLYLHLVRVRHIYPGGYLVHHLFVGVLILIPSAFLLAFVPRRRSLAISATVGLGVGSAMVLDEVVYLVMTKGTDADYVSHTSLYGAFLFISLAVILLLLIYRSQRG